MHISWKNIQLLFKYHFTDQPVDSPEPDKDLGVVSLGFNLDQFYRNLLSYKKFFTITVAGTIVYKSKSYPIYEVDINPDAKQNILILSGTHGNEQAGMLCIPDLLEDITSNPDIYKWVHIKILVPHNPVGANFFSRFNGEGIDLNRDFKKRRTKENKLLIQLVDTYRPMFVIALHEGPQEDTFIYCSSLVEKNFALKVLAYAQKQGVELARKNYFTTRLRIPGYFPLQGFIYYLIVLWSAILNMQSEGYYMKLRGIPNITIESSWKDKDKFKRIQSQLQIIKGIIANLS